MATFNNMATLSYNGVITNSNVVTGELQELLTATKTAVVDDYAPGDGITYVITITNGGQTPFTNLTVTDDLGAYPFGAGSRMPLTYQAGSLHYYVNGVPQTAPAVTAGNQLVITGVNVPAGGSATLIYEAEANQFAPLGADGSIVNTALISGAGVSPALEVCATVRPRSAASLTISKSLCPGTVTENGQLTYTFIIQNTGNTPVTVSDDVVLTDAFDPILNPIAVTFNGTAWTAGTNYAYNAATGLFSTLEGQITVPAATYTRDPATGAWVINPGVSTLVVTGTV